MDKFSRKLEHLNLALRQNTPINHSLNKMQLLPDSLPEVDFNKIDTSINILGHTLNAPILIAPLTGGSPETEKINLSLAKVAHDLGIGMSVGSQRPLLTNSNLLYTYQVRKVAPGILLFANIGVSDIRNLEKEQIESIVHNIQADALMIHMNPMQEIFQPEGNKDFTGLLEKLRDIKNSTSIPIFVRSIGCGIDPITVKRLLQIGVEGIDVAANDGTNWISIEGNRREEKEWQAAAITFKNWGIDLFTNLKLLKNITSHTTIIATGGITNGLQGAKTLVLGAKLFSLGRFSLEILMNKGEEELKKELERIILELKIAMFGIGIDNISGFSHIDYYEK